MLQDYLFFGVDTQVNYCYRMLHLSNLVEEASRRHELTTNRALLLSDTLLASVLLSSILDDEERINLRVHCGSDFTIGTETTCQAETRGYIDCNENSFLVQQIDLGLAMVGGDCGQSGLELYVRSVRARLGKAGLFEGQTVSKTDSIETALNEHLVSSYQMNTRLFIASWNNEEENKINAFGVIYQELPEISLESAQKLKHHLATLRSVKELFLQNRDPDVLASKLIPDKTKAIKSLSPKFICHCSQERVESMLVTLSSEELKDILNKCHDLDIKCHYCSKKYTISVNTISQIYASCTHPEPHSHEMN